MQIKTISITYKRTFNLGNYESVTLACEQTAELEEGDDAEECILELSKSCKNAVKKNIPPNYVPLVQSNYKVAGLEVSDNGNS